MKITPLFIVALLSTAACSKVIGPDTDDDVDTDVDTDTPECTDDFDCLDGQICTEGSECITGDRDNSFEDSTPILQNSGKQGWIAPAGDIDYYLYPSTGAEWVRINTKTNVTNCDEESTDSVDVTENLDTVVAVYGPNGTLHAWMDNFPTGRVSKFDSVLNVYLPTAGDWYITVEDTSTFFEVDDGARSEPNFFYCLEVVGSNAATSETDSSETPSWTADISSTSSIWNAGVVINEPGDSDWLEITLPAPGPIEIWGHEEIPGSPATSLVKVYNENGDKILEKADIGGNGVGVYYDGAAATYLIEATDYLGAGGDENWYVLYIRSRANDYYGQSELEPNDISSEAQALTMNPYSTSNGTGYDGALFHGILEQENDEDMFSFESTPDFYHTVRCAADSVGALSDLAVEILDSDGDVVASETDGEEDSAPDLNNFVPTNADTYYAKIYSEDDIYGPGSYYRCYLFITSFEWN